jgi:hypothetical protein
MPTGLNFNTLITNLQSYLERGSAIVDTTVFEQLPSLINMAERAIAQKLKIQGFQNTVTSTLVAKNPVYAKPDRWRETISMSFGTGTAQNTSTPLFARSYEYARDYWPDDSQTAQPEFYADYDFYHWLIVPTPPISYPWEILYWEQPALLDAVNTTNWLTNEAPNALLYRALLECTPFLKEDERIPTWQAMYEEAIENLSGEDLQKMYDRSNTRKTS